MSCEFRAAACWTHGDTLSSTFILLFIIRYRDTLSSIFILLFIIRHRDTLSSIFILLFIIRHRDTLSSTFILLFIIRHRDTLSSIFILLFIIRHRDTLSSTFILLFIIRHRDTLSSIFILLFIIRHRDTLSSIFILLFFNQTDTHSPCSNSTIFIFIMLFALFVLCSALTPALCCDWLTQFSKVNEESLTLLQLMGGPLTEEESPVPFPYGLYRHMRNTQVESQLVFIRDSLKLISELYRHGNLSSVTWDTNKTECFLTNIHRQTEELNDCVLTEKRVIRLRKYYKRLTKSTLDRTGGSTASWELIRKETTLHLEQLQMLVGSITRRHSAASPH